MRGSSFGPFTLIARRSEKKSPAAQEGWLWFQARPVRSLQDCKHSAGSYRTPWAGVRYCFGNFSEIAVIRSPAVVADVGSCSCVDQKAPHKQKAYASPEGPRKYLGKIYEVSLSTIVRRLIALAIFRSRDFLRLGTTDS